MSGLDERFLAVLEALVVRLEGRSIDWALTGSTAHVLQGVSVTPNDVDVQTTEEGAYAIEAVFAGEVVDPVSPTESTTIRSHFGAFELGEIRVEVMGDVQKRRADGTWEPPVDVTEHRTFVDVGGLSVPVLSLEYEVAAYERMGRSGRAALLADHVE